MTRWSVITVLLLSLTGCGLRGDLYLQDADQQTVKPAANPADMKAAEQQLDVVDISNPDLLQTEEEASSEGLDDAVDAP